MNGESTKRNALYVHQLFRYSSVKDKFLILGGILFAFVGGCGLPASIVLFGRLSNSSVTYSVSKKKGSSNQSESDKTDQNERFIKEVEAFGIGSCFIGCVQLICCYLMIVSLSYAARSQIRHIKLLYFKAILRQELAWFDTYREDLTIQAGETLSKLEEVMGQKLALLLFMFTECWVNLVLALYFGWKLTLVILSLVPVLIILTIIFHKIQIRLEAKESAAYSKAAILAEEAISAIRMVVAFGGEDTIVQWYKEKLKDAHRAGIHKGFVQALGQAVAWAVDYASYCLAFWYGVQLIIESNKNNSKEYDASILIIVFFASMMGAMAFGQAFPYWDALISARTLAYPVFAIIERIPKIDNGSQIGLKPSTFRGMIEIRNVSFSYPARPEVPILNKVNLKFSVGEKVALVGSSGCGKSTILHLIQRFYDPDEGEVLIDGRNIRDLNLQWVRQKIGSVTQEPALFAGNIKDNISMGQTVTTEQIVEVCKSSNAHDFIIKLPSKYSTLVGEGGAHLSGGQKQKIALARALIKNPPILLLDEATSALDSQSEKIVQTYLEETGIDRTTIIVAHRLQTVRNCNRIVVLDHGKIMEIGNHDELMKKKELYYSLVKSQLVQDIQDKDLDSDLESEKLSRLLSIKRPKRVSVLSESKSSIELGKTQAPSIVRILKLNKQEWWQILLGSLGALSFGCTIPCYALLFGEVMKILDLSITDPELAKENIDFYSLFFILIAVWAGLSIFLQLYMFSIAGEYLTMRLRHMVMVAVLKQEIAWFDSPQNSTGAICTRLSSDACNVQGATGVGIAILLQALGALGISLILALNLVWKQALVSSFMIPLICIATYFESRFITDEVMQEMHDQEASAQIAIEAIANIKTIAALSLEKTFYEKFKESMSLAKKNRRINSKPHWRGLLFGFSQAIESWSYGLSLWYGGYLIRTEGVAFEDIFKVGELLIFGALMVGQSIAFAPNYNKGLVSAARIFTLLDRTPRINTNITSTEQPQLKGSRIEFKQVKFSFPTRPARVLRDFNCSINHGQTVALVGSSGCGKSTCFQLLERFYDPSEGEVLYANRTADTLNLRWLRSQFGLVPQEPVLFDTSVAENIAFGDSSRKVSMEEIIDAAQKGNIHNFIVSLPNGYETMLGRKGTQLSGGQKQRIAIARALIRNPEVLLLDEATSALDAESEKLVQAALDKAMVGRTSIIIAHRLITIQDADKIVVMHSGHVVEEGTHKELMENKGVYYQMILLSG